MKAPSLHKTTALSAVLHLTLFLVAALVLKQSTHMKLPSPYIVDLVSPSGRSVAVRRHHTRHHVTREVRRTRKVIPARKHVEEMKKKREMKEIREMTDERRVKDRIAELAAIDRIKQITKLREIISIPAKDRKPVSGKETQSDSKKAGQETIGSYMDKITGEIWKQFYYPPDTGEKNLEAVVSVVIGRDGTITVQKIEKSSGNPIFDRSALVALKNASPVTPPPDRTELEIGIRFVL